MLFRQFGEITDGRAAVSQANGDEPEDCKEDKVALLEFVRNSIIGKDDVILTPFGKKRYGSIPSTFRENLSIKASNSSLFLD